MSQFVFKTFHNNRGIEQEVQYPYENGRFVQPKLYACDICQISDLDEEYINNHSKYNYHYHTLLSALKKEIKELNEKVDKYREAELNSDNEIMSLKNKLDSLQIKEISLSNI